MITPAEADKVLDQNAKPLTKALKLIMGGRSLSSIQSICKSLAANTTLNGEN